MIHEPSPPLPTPIECAAVQVKAPDLLLRPELVQHLAMSPEAWRELGPPTEHDYRELVRYFIESWPQIVAQHKKPPAPPNGK